MRVLVTGHNGYIGSVMVPELRAAGHEVVGLDTFFFEDCTLTNDREGVTAIRKDIREVGVSDLQGLDAVIHLAALCNDPLGDLHAGWTEDINHRASTQLARFAREAGVRRFLYASSCSMYGSAGTDDLLTEEAPLRPLTAYATSKVRTEEDVAKLASSSFSPVFMRNATAYGLSPRLRADVVLNNLVCWAHHRAHPHHERWHPVASHRPRAGHRAGVRDRPDGPARGHPQSGLQRGRQRRELPGP